jgi:hypothetical protein
VSRRREYHIVRNLGAIGEKDHAIAGLWNAVMRGVQESVSCYVAFPLERLAGFLRNILAAVVEYVRHIFHKQSERFQDPDVAKIFQIEPSSGIKPESLRMRVDLPKLRAPDTGEGLAGGPPYQHVEGQAGRPQAETGGQSFGRKLQDVSRAGVTLLPWVKIQTVRRGGFRVQFYGSRNLKARTLETE